VDTDRQQSAAHWWQSREGDLPELVTSKAFGVTKALQATKRAWIMVDTPPQVGEEVRGVAEAVGYVLVITRPSVLDLRAIAPTIDIVRQLDTPGAILLNACPPGRGVAEASLVTEARRALAVYGLPVCPVAITQRASFSHAITAGKGITEYEPESPAADEIRRLWAWLSVRS
jgi:chromosome partitioning protein